jgi:hypothetical protein
VDILRTVIKRLVIRILIGFSALILFYLVCGALACLPGLLLLSPGQTTTMGGITTLQDAVDACRRSGLEGWELVEHAQKIVAHKFTYSRRNSWESPRTAFARGRGFCVQQALALKAIYDELGIKARAVHGRGDFMGMHIHGVWEPGGNFNHSWLEVTVQGRSLYVCPGSVENAPGKLDFHITGKVKDYTPILHTLSFPGYIIVNAVRDFKSTRFRRETYNTTTT